MVTPGWQIQPGGEFDLNKRKQMKINESKIAFICFLLFTFIFSNRDFSMGYGRFKQKFSSRSWRPVLVAKRAGVAPGPRANCIGVEPGSSLRAKRSNPGVVGGLRPLDRGVASLLAMTIPPKRSTH
jgi:hypothetical protein